MTTLETVAWPPAPIRTERLVLRASRAGDRAAFIELLAAPEVHVYLGGPRSREDLEHAVPEVPGHRPGTFVADLDGALIGVVTLDRRAADRPGPVGPGAATPVTTDRPTPHAPGLPGTPDGRAPPA